MKKLLAVFVAAVMVIMCLSLCAFAVENTMSIRSADDLEELAELVNSGSDFEGVTVSLECDIALNPRVVNASGDVREGNFKQWTPIGTEKSPFRGNFDGNGYTISGLYINNDLQFQGLFGVVSGAQIRNIYLEDSYIKTADHAGAIVGYAKDETIISSCHNVNTSVYTKNRSGGIVGWTNNAYIYNCSSSGYCYSDRCSGGIVGDVYSGGKLYNCENCGTVEGNSLVGGISGGTTSADIQNCLNVGKVSSGYHIAGGAGSRKITNCFAYQNDEFNSNIGGQAYIFSSPAAILDEAVKVGETEYAKVVDALNAYAAAISVNTPMTPWSQYESFPFVNRTNLKTSFGSTASSWSKGELESAYAYDLIPENLVGEDLTKPITRLEFVAVSVKVYENLAATKALPATINPFEDCDDMEMLKAYNLGITEGISKTQFNPSGLLNREMAATMLTRVFKRSTMPGWSLDDDTSFPLAYTAATTFADDSLISDWAKESVYFMNANNIILGVSDNRFAPKNITDEDEATGYANATREQALLIAVRMVDNLK